MRRKLFIALLAVLVLGGGFFVDFKTHAPIVTVPALVQSAEAQNIVIPTATTFYGTGVAYVSTANVTLLASPGTGLKYYVGEVKCVNSSSSATVAALVNSQNTSGGVTR